ncbi:MAG: flavodoxin-dependent (E)-4-hydroxy-3-methylbut-2-enyl-diphosphate synthase [Bacillota bacterium]|jgi:(E)-4-hydroxy-3-methylbut-2-enyl-diphosphate synthase|nr:flavodoxin-dependent (E)-4-hydroxy-3-methylbut-2-enyl-diphosphate synthase [Bacillota bacterium]NLJ04045.1 flavodoxin-dependent (E)-4-hydroxy-3-methylbut-2-enyl-diphosphate synthase [Bacillota bacterium]
MRESTRQVMVGGVPIGGGAPITVQSMTNTDTRDAQATLRQIEALAAAGCDIVRVAVPDREAAEALFSLVPHSPIPVVADIHFDHRLALQALEAGIHKLRLNPGNIGSEAKVLEVVKAAQERQVPIRIGVNSGSVAKHLLDKYGRTATAMVESALEHIAIFERLGFYDIVVSLKSTEIDMTVEAYEELSRRVSYPTHLGITEAGTKWFGTVKSAAGLGALLSRGLGDTLRVSLTADPVEEVKVGWAVLSSLGLRRRGPIFISCPTCGRTEIDLEGIAAEVEKRLSDFPLPITIAVMGCVVNGPGEARSADLGITGGKGVGLVFRHGEILRKVPEHELVDALVEEANNLLAER